MHETRAFAGHAATIAFVGELDEWEPKALARRRAIAFRSASAICGAGLLALGWFLPGFGEGHLLACAFGGLLTITALFFPRALDRVLNGMGSAGSTGM